jgi:hypothetical protein
MAAEGVDALEPITKIPPSTQRVPTEYPIELQRSSMQMRQNPRIPVCPKHKNQEAKTLAVDLAYHIAAVYKAVLTNLVEIFDGKLYESETSTTPISKK